MPRPELTPDEQLHEAWQQLRQHRLLSDDQIKESIEATVQRERRRFWLKSGGSAVGAAVLLLALGVGMGSNERLPNTLILSIQALVAFFLAMGWTSAFHQHRQRHHLLRQAQQAIERRDYASSALGSALIRSCSDITPLKEDDWNWRWLSEALSKPDEADTELSTLWGQWLLSDLPIRQVDVDALQKVIRAKKKALEWHAIRNNAQLQQEGRRAALEALPPELVSSLKGERLDERLVQASTGGPKPRL